MLTDDDLAYMRAVQAEARPTAAAISRLTQVPDGMGGWTEGYGAPDPLMVRIDGSPDAVPASLGDREDAPTLVKITADLIEIRAGDHIAVEGAESYEVISEGDTDRWATAQQVIARRL